MKTKLSFLILLYSNLAGAENSLFWWDNKPDNFGDILSPIIIEKLIGKEVKHASLESPSQILLSTGSVLHFARDGDIIWGSGFREDPTDENRFSFLDVRAVRGPITRNYLLMKGIDCPEVYGDPAALMCYFFPEYLEEDKIYDYIIIPNIGEMNCFQRYKNVVNPTENWKEILRKINQSKLVISSSLHGIIIAESYGIPARLLKMTWIESIIKYQDYYESTGRPSFKYATSVQEALMMGGEEKGSINLPKLLDAFPKDYFYETDTKN